MTSTDWRTSVGIPRRHVEIDGKRVFSFLHEWWCGDDYCDCRRVDVYIDGVLVEEGELFTDTGWDNDSIQGLEDSKAAMRAKYPDLPATWEKEH